MGRTSLAAKAVAQDVIATVAKGKIPNKGKISMKHGYSRLSAKSSKAIRTKAYKEAIRPVVEQMEEERQRAITMMKKKIGKAKYRDLVDSVDKLTKNLRLLNDQSTSNVAIGVKRLSDQELEKLTDESE